MQKRNIYYKGMRLNSLGLPVIGNKPLKKDRKLKRKYLKSFSTTENNQKHRPKSLLIIYDIPHANKKERDWFRRQLINLGFVMIQKSVWVGPSPLPKDFVSYLKRIGLKEQWKTFKLSQPYTFK